jgi:hypothetical protein
MKQTAVEWLYEVFYSTDTFKQAEVLKKALEMEKEQIMRTAWHCHIEGVEQGSKTSQEYIKYAEQYYNETFKSEE